MTLTRLPLPKLGAIYYGGKGQSEEDSEALNTEYGDKLKPRRDRK